MMPEDDLESSPFAAASSPPFVVAVFVSGVLPTFGTPLVALDAVCAGFGRSNRKRPASAVPRPERSSACV